MKRAHKHIAIGSVFAAGAFSVFYFFIPTIFSVAYRSDEVGDIPITTATTSEDVALNVSLDKLEVKVTR